MGGDQFFGRYGERLGSADQVGFVIGKEFERRGQHGRIVQPCAQGIGIEPGQPQEPVGPVAVLQHPAERGQRQCLRRKRGGVVMPVGSVRDCGGLLLGVGGWIGI